MGLRAGNIVALSAAALVASASAAVAEVKASDPESILRTLHEFGYTAKMETDSDGDPKIVSRVSDTRADSTQVRSYPACSR